MRDYCAILGCRRFRVLANSNFRCDLHRKDQDRLDKQNSEVDPLTPVKALEELESHKVIHLSRRHELAAAIRTKFEELQKLISDEGWRRDQQSSQRMGL